MDAFGAQGTNPPDRVAPGLDVGGLAIRELARRVGVDPGRVGGVADEQVKLRPAA